MNRSSSFSPQEAFCVVYQRIATVMNTKRCFKQIKNFKCGVSVAVFDFASLYVIKEFRVKAHVFPWRDPVWFRENPWWKYPWLQRTCWRRIRCSAHPVSPSSFRENSRTEKESKRTQMRPLFSLGRPFANESRYCRWTIFHNLFGGLALWCGSLWDASFCIPEGIFELTWAAFIYSGQGRYKMDSFVLKMKPGKASPKGFFIYEGCTKIDRSSQITRCMIVQIFIWSPWSILHMSCTYSSRLLIMLTLQCSSDTVGPFS